jgi:uncharacterized protein YndB with AHSA1/START domain
MKWITRIGSGLLVVSLLAFAIIVFLSSRDEFKELHTSVLIHRKPEVIWPWLYEPDKLKSWVSWLSEVRRDGSGPPSPGTRVVWIMMDENNGSTRMEIPFVVEQAESLRRLAVRFGTPGTFQGTAAYTLIDRGDGSTELKSEGRYDFDSGFAKLMLPLITWQARKKLDMDLATLRKLVEGQISAQ